MNGNEILLNSILELKQSNEISQEAIDNHFYDSGEEIKYIYSPDKEKIAIHFADNITGFKSKLANYGLAYDLETVKETSNINIEYSKNYVKNHVLYKELRLENGHIYSEITNDLLEDIKMKTQENKDRVDKDYIYKNEIEKHTVKLNGFKETYNEINSYIDDLVFDYLNKGEDYSYIKELKEAGIRFSTEHDNYKLVDNDSLKQSFLKFQNLKLKTKEDKIEELHKIKILYLEVLLNDIEVLEKDIKSIKNSQKYYEEYKNKIFKGIFKKTNNKVGRYISNEEIFNNIIEFVKKYLNDYYIIENNIIKLKDENNYILESLDINEDLDNFNIENTYNYESNKSNLSNKENKIEFFNNFLFYKEYNTYSQNKDITKNIKYLAVKDSIIKNNIESFNNENIIYIEKDKLDNILNSINKKLSISSFGNIFQLIEEDSTNGKEYYYIQDESGKNLSNYKDIETLLSGIINKTDFNEKEDILEKVNNLILGNYIHIVGFTLTGRKNINKGTKSTTTIFNLHKSNFQSFYTKFYQSTKDEIYNKISGNTINYLDTNKEYLNSEFENCILDSYEGLIKKVNDRTKLYCNTETLKIN